jgi:hypothetical protein
MVMGRMVELRYYVRDLKPNVQLGMLYGKASEVKSISNEDPSKPKRLHELALAFLSHYEQSRERDDPDAYHVLYSQQAVELSLANHPERAKYLSELAKGRLCRLMTGSDDVDDVEAIILKTRNWRCSSLATTTPNEKSISPFSLWANILASTLLVICRILIQSYAL